MTIDFNSTGSGDKVKDYFDSAADFESHLDEAESMAANNWEHNFVSDMAAKFEEYGIKMYMSQRQYETLMRIIEGE